MKKFSIIFTGLLIISNLFAQNCVMYLPQDEGTTLKYQSIDHKEKPSGSYSYTINKISNTEGKTTADVTIIQYDKKGEELYKNDVVMYCENNNYYVDMESFLNGQQMSAYENMEVSIDATSLNFPAEMNIGDELEDGVLKITVTTSGIPIMSMTTLITNRKVESVETVSTEAGNFECYRITYGMQIKTVMDINYSCAEWYSKGVGLIKSETFKSNGDLAGRTKLVSISK